MAQHERMENELWEGKVGAFEESNRSDAVWVGRQIGHATSEMSFSVLHRLLFTPPRGILV